MSILATIYIDHRENAMERGSSSDKKSPIAFFDKIIDASNRKHGKKTPATGGGIINYEVTEIPVGDYCIVLAGGILAMAIERKEWKDLAASISDGRADAQANAMRKAQAKYGCKISFLVEGGFTYQDRTQVGGKHGKPFSALHSKLRHEMLKDIPFVQSKNTEHSADIIVKFARDLIKMRARGDLAFPLQETNTSDQMLSAYLYAINQINEQFREIEGSANLTAALTDITEQVEFAKLSLTDTDTSTNELPWASGSGEGLPSDLRSMRKAGDADIIALIWEAIPGITRNSSPIISEKYSFLDFLNVAGDDDALNTLREEISELKFHSGIRIGNQAKKITDSFRTTDAASAVAVAMISEVPGVTGAVAERILENVTLRDICTGDVTAAMIADIKKTPGGRRVGPAMAAKILKFFGPQLDS